MRIRVGWDGKDRASYGPSGLSWDMLVELPSVKDGQEACDRGMVSGSAALLRRA